MTEDEMASLALKYVSGDLSAADPIDPDVKIKLDELRAMWQDLENLPIPKPGPALRAQFYQKLNRYSGQQSWWQRSLVMQIAAGLTLFLAGLGVGQLHRSKQALTEVAELRTQVEGLRQTVALSLMDKQSASSRLQGVEWSSQVNQPDQELLTALLATLNHDQNINVRLAALEALEKFTSDINVRKALEQSISTQQSPLVQIAMIDALVHIRDNAAAAKFQQLSTNSELNSVVRQRAQWAVQKLSLE